MTGPRIAIFGLSLRSAWGNGHATTYRALAKGLMQLGCRVEFYERQAPWYDNSADDGAAPFCPVRLYTDLSEIRAFAAAIAKADLVILGSYVQDGGALARLLLDLAPGRVAFYDIDTPVTIEALEAGACAYLDAELIPSFSAYFSFTGGPTLAVLRTRFKARNASALYCGVDCDLHAPKRTVKRWAMSYLGTYSADRQDALEAMLLEAARRRPDERFCVAGALYPDRIIWPANVERIEHVPPHRHAQFYSSSRITLNLTRDAMRRLGWSPSVRLFEAAASGAAIASDSWPGLDEAFRPGREIIVFEDGADPCRLLDRLDASTARALGVNARARAIRDHSGVARARTLLAAVGLAPELAVEKSTG